MAITRQKKEEIVEKLSGIAKSAATVVFVGFKGLTVSEASAMRKALREQGIGYTVAKKTLIKRVFSGGSVKGEMPEMEGEVAVAYGTDELAPAREIAMFMKKFTGHLSFAGGIFGGNFVGKEEITSIAAIPGMDALRAQFVQLINSPLQRFAVVLSEQAKKQG